MSKKSAYAAAGVDIDAGNRAVDLMRSAVRSTYGPEVLLGIGAFGGLYDASRLKKLRAPVLVGSTDSVGTKIMVSCAIGSYETLGWDIVNHCVNDILVQGAEPLFFLDYVAAPQLDPEAVAAVVGGVAAACREAGCAILGGETAELPGVYAEGEMDLVGAIVGLVDRHAIIDGSTIEAGDALIGLPSSGLHTNGFSLARSVLPSTTWGQHEARLGRTIGEALAEPHRSYLSAIRAMPESVTIKGLAHITGGGFVDNIPRILPSECGAVVERSAWRVPPLFQLIQERGRIDGDEMYRVFNMGMGMVVVVSQDDVVDALSVADEGARQIGQVVERTGGSTVKLA